MRTTASPGRRLEKNAVTGTYSAGHTCLKKAVEKLAVDCRQAQDMGTESLRNEV